MDENLENTNAFFVMTRRFLEDEKRIGFNSLKTPLSRLKTSSTPSILISEPEFEREASKLIGKSDDLVASMKLSMEGYIKSLKKSSKSIVDFLKACKEYEGTQINHEFKVFYPTTKKKYLIKSFISFMKTKLNHDSYKLNKSIFTENSGLSALKCKVLPQDLADTFF
jgi:hypothetical protein